MRPPEQLAMPVESPRPGVYGRRTSPVYGVHAYHTKVPPEAIVSHLEAHTQRGELVLDPFCGSGMTGVAALMSGRRALLSDLSPAAVHIAENYTTPCDPEAFSSAVARVLGEVGDAIRAMYETSQDGSPATVEYVVWSDVRTCPACEYSFALWEVRDEGLRALTCPHCRRATSKKDYPLVGERPVLVNLSLPDTRRRVERAPTEVDLGREAVPASLPWHPTHHFGPDRPMWRRGHSDLGISTIADFYSRRNLAALALLWAAAADEADPRLRAALRFSLTAVANRASRRYQWNPKRPTNVLGSTLYISSLRYEWNVLSLWKRKVMAVRKLFAQRLAGDVRVTRASATNLPWPSSVADYCFTDPPFGGHIVYSDSSLLWEAWLDDLMNREQEAIVVGSGSHAKSVADYQELIGSSLAEMHRVMKPTASATVVFQATDNSVWRALEDACEAAGFIVDDASVLTKGQPSFKQVKGKGEGERVAATDVVLTLRSRKRRRGRAVRNDPLLSVLHGEIAGGRAAATSGHLFGVAAAAALRSGSPPLTFDELLAILRGNFHETNGLWTLRENDELAA